MILLPVKESKMNQYWKEYFVYDATDALTAGTGVLFETNSIRIDSDADFEFLKTSFESTSDRVKLKYKDESAGRYLFKGSIDIKEIAGRNTLAMGNSNAFLPFIWPKPYLVAAATLFTVESADYSGVANTMRLAFHGAKIRSGQAPWERKFRAAIPFVYGFTNGSVSVAANSTSSQNIEIDIDSHFLVQKIVGIRDGGALVSIGENARGMDWMNTAIHIDNLIGNGAFPNILPAPRFIRRGSVVTVNIQNLMAIANVVNISLIGTKLYE